MADSELDAEAARQMVDIMQAGLPLAAGLRALGEEAPSRRLRHFFSTAGRRLEAGESIEVVFGADAKGVPAPLQGLMRAGVESGRVGMVLEEYLIVSRRAIDHRYRAVVSLLYPCILLVVAIGVFSFAATTIIPEFKAIFSNFGTQLPPITELLLFATDMWATFGLWIVLGVLVVACCLWLGVRLVGGRRLARRVVCGVPLLGTVLRCTALSEFCRLLALLVDNGVPLPSAVRLTGGAVRDADLEAACGQLADDVEGGQPLQQAAVTIRQFPPSLLQVFHWSDRREAFVDALRAASEVFEARSRIAAHALVTVLEPMTILVVALSVGFFVMAMFMPLVKLLNDLS